MWRGAICGPFLRPVRPSGRRIARALSFEGVPEGARSKPLSKKSALALGPIAVRNALAVIMAQHGLLRTQKRCILSDIEFYGPEGARL